MSSIDSAGTVPYDEVITTLRAINSGLIDCVVVVDGLFINIIKVTVCIYRPVFLGSSYPG